MPKITKRVVDAIEPNGTDYYVFDSELIGFGVRVRKTGGLSYIVRYRAGSGRGAPVRRVTIAPVGKITPDQAREVAKGLLATVVQGEDPAKQKTEKKNALTFQELVDHFLAHVEAKKKPNTHYLYSHLLKTYAVPEWGKRKAGSVTAQDIVVLHLSLKNKPTTANRVRNVLSTMYTWATKGKLLAKMDNPASGVEKYKENSRERYLSGDEMLRLGDAIEEAETVGIAWTPDPTKKVKHAPKAENRRTVIDPSAAAAIRLFILTGARLREILHLTWDMVDIERSQLMLPDSKTGKKSIILNAPAKIVLASLPRISRFVIPGKVRFDKDGKQLPDRPRSDLNRPWRLVRKHAGLVADADNPHFRVRLHDLRHTHASVGVGASFGLPIVGKLLGHTQARTTERYAHLETDPLIAASEVIGSRIADAMGMRKEQKDNVIPIKKADG
ncbi:site-specific integrase [Phyllobacterium chamaecytisi]|uniref:site-specific integrase n=1 Tax=Phyllobacterium chamaecytisi TaxID=2876082 RepID=UPI001CCD09A4|nr:site-specific integrase [Phyllobacterium sp. KW56]MBZ9603991.1 site-specific integrase [Phyllobacterium sp. KW56]